VGQRDLTYGRRLCFTRGRWGLWTKTSEPDSGGGKGITSKRVVRKDKETTKLGESRGPERGKAYLEKTGIGGTAKRAYFEEHEKPLAKTVAAGSRRNKGLIVRGGTN